MRYPEVHWCVISSAPGSREHPRLPAGLRSFFSFSWVRTVRMLRTVDGVVFGGGSLFTDVESVRASVLWGIHVWMAQLLRKPVYLAFQGIGPFRSRLGEWIARRCVGSAAFVSVRDQESAERIRQWNVNINVIQSFDPVFLLMQNKKEELRTKKVFSVIPRVNQPATFLKMVVEHCKKGEFDAVHIVSLHPDSIEERQTCMDIQVSVSQPAVIVPVHSLEELARCVSESSLVLTARFHGALAAYALGIPVILCPQRDGDKLWALQQFMLLHPDPQGVRETIVGAELALKDVLTHSGTDRNAA